jgi:hypothetical protein
MLPWNHNVVRSMIVLRPSTGVKTFDQALREKKEGLPFYG